MGEKDGAGSFLPDLIGLTYPDIISKMKKEPSSAKARTMNRILKTNLVQHSEEQASRRGNGDLLLRSWSLADGTMCRNSSAQCNMLPNCSITDPSIDHDHVNVNEEETTGLSSLSLSLSLCSSLSAFKKKRPRVHAYGSHNNHNTIDHAAIPMIQVSLLLGTNLKLLSFGCTGTAF